MKHITGQKDINDHTAMGSSKTYIIVIVHRCRLNIPNNILHLDFSNLTEPDQISRAVSEAKEIIGAQPEGSFRTLTDVTGIATDAHTVKALWELLRHDKPFVKAGAVVGIADDEQDDLYQLLTHQTRRRLATFENLDAAKDWLAEQS